MRFLNSIGLTTLTAALMITIGTAAAFDDWKYPNLKGQWRRFVPYRTRSASAWPSIPASRSVESNHR